MICTINLTSIASTPQVVQREKIITLHSNKKTPREKKKQNKFVRISPPRRQILLEPLKETLRRYLEFFARSTSTIIRHEGPTTRIRLDAVPGEVET